MHCGDSRATPVGEGSLDGLEDFYNGTDRTDELRSEGKTEGFVKSQEGFDQRRCPVGYNDAL